MSIIPASFNKVHRGRAQAIKQLNRSLYDLIAMYREKMSRVWRAADKGGSNFEASLSAVSERKPYGVFCPPLVMLTNVPVHLTLSSLLTNLLRHFSSCT